MLIKIICGFYYDHILDEFLRILKITVRTLTFKIFLGSFSDVETSFIALRFQTCSISAILPNQIFAWWTI